MKRLACALLPILALTFGAAAQTEVKLPPDMTETIQVRKAAALANAISAVTGNHPVVVGQGPNARPVDQPYDITPEVRWVLNDNLHVLTVFIENAAKIQKAALQKAQADNGGKPLRPARDAVRDADGKIVVDEVLSDAQVALNEKLSDIMDSERPVAKLGRVKKSDLKGPIPGSVIEAMRPIIVE